MRLYHPHFGETINVEARELSEDPDTQVAQTIGMMRDYANADSESPELRADAMNAIDLPAGWSINTPTVSEWAIADNWRDISNVTFRNSRGRAGIQFVPDDQTAAPFASFLSGPIVETLVRPIDMRRMRWKHGDCDDFSMTMAARLRALGIPCSFVTVAVDRENPSRFSHVYVAAYPPGGKRIALDASHGDFPGWEVPNLFGRRVEWPLDGSSARGALFATLAIAGSFAAGYAVGHVMRASR